MTQNLLPSALPDKGFFIGREIEFNRIQSLFEHNKIVFVEGLSGIGKTSLTLHYAYETFSNYQAILWYEIQDDDSLASILESIAVQMQEQGLPAFLETLSKSGKNRNVRVKSLIEQLRKTKILFILDAFEYCLTSKRLIDEEFSPLFTSLFQMKYQSRILLSTKIQPKINPHYLGQYKTIELEGLSDQDSAKFVNQQCKAHDFSISQTDTTRLHQVTDGHPFALNTIMQLLQSGDDLPTLLQKKRAKIISDYDNYLLEMLYGRLPDAIKELLGACSLFRRPFATAAIKRLPIKFKDIHELFPYFFIKRGRDNQQYVIHTIIRDYAMNKLRANESLYRDIHKAIGNYYASVLKKRKRRYDLQMIPPILETLHHYQEAHDHKGQIAVVMFITENLKSLLRQIVNQGETKLARKTYQAIFAVNKADSEVHQDYGKLLEYQGANPQKIEDHYQRAAELAKENPQRQMNYPTFRTLL